MLLVFPRGGLLFFSIRKSIFIIYKQKMTINNNILQNYCFRSILLSLNLCVLTVSLHSRLMPLDLLPMIQGENSILGIRILIPSLPLILLYNLKQVLISLYYVSISLSVEFLLVFLVWFFLLLLLFSLNDDYVGSRRK